MSGSEGLCVVVCSLVLLQAVCWGLPVPQSGAQCSSNQAAATLSYPWYRVGEDSFNFSNGNTFGQKFGNMRTNYYFTWNKGWSKAQALAYLQEMEPPRSMLAWKLYEGEETSDCSLYNCPEDNIVDPAAYPAAGCGSTFPGIWWTNGAEAIRNSTHKYFQYLYDNGADVDIWVLDVEKGMSMWTIGTNPDNVCVQQRWRAIENDPRFPSVLSDLVSRGFEVPMDPTDVLLNTVANWRGNWNGGYHHNYLVWNSYVGEKVASYYNYSLYEPAAAFFPNLRCSDYSASYTSVEYGFPDNNGHFGYLWGTGSHVGTAQASSSYGAINGLATQNNRLGPGTGYYVKNAFNAFRFDINSIRKQALSRPDVPVTPWLARRGWVGDSAFDPLMRNNDLYQDKIFHMMLTGAVEYVLYWNHPAETDNSGFPDATYLAHSMQEADAMIGCSDRQSLVTNRTSWTSLYVQSGMRVENRLIFRFTPDLDRIPFSSATGMDSPPVTAADVTVSSEPAIFVLLLNGTGTEGVSIRFRGSRIVQADIPFPTVSQKGEWIEISHPMDGPDGHIVEQSCSVAVDGADAAFDDCGVCSGGNTGHLANSDKCMDGRCFCAEFPETGSNEPSSSESPVPSSSESPVPSSSESPEEYSGCSNAAPLAILMLAVAAFTL